MLRRVGIVLSLAGLVLVPLLAATQLPACCPLGRSGKPVVNADQTVVILWDAAAKTQHFIRKASFQSMGDDFAFLIPTPNRPELEESGNGVFPYLQKLTEPEIELRSRPKATGGGCACSEITLSKNVAPTGEAAPPVRVVTEKQVAGFDAVVLEADSADALVDWLNENGYEFSPAAEAWAKPYVDAGWMITALKVASQSEPTEGGKVVEAAALRLSFETDRPLFPYREPDSGDAAKELGATRRLLRIYFIGEGRYAGELTKEDPWTGRVAFADKFKPGDREKVLDLLKLPASTGPEEWWLTEFEDNWAYRVAPADVYFAKAADQATVKRPPIIQYVSTETPVDLTTCVFIVAVIAGPTFRRFVRGRKK